VDAGELKLILLIAAGGAIGSVARYLLANWLNDSSFPWGTAAVNISGCFAIGLLFFYATAQGSLAPEVRAFAFVGVLGGFTTMSSFSLETIALFEGGKAVLASANIGVNVLVCLAGTFLGRAAGLWAGG
jgi:CrcB protein